MVQASFVFRSGVGLQVGDPSIRKLGVQGLGFCALGPHGGSAVGPEAKNPPTDAVAAFDEAMEEPARVWGHFCSLLVSLS